jgi:hypothetical protein
MPEQRAFASTVAPKQGDTLAPLDVQMNAVEHCHAIGIAEVYIVDV